MRLQSSITRHRDRGEVSDLQHGRDGDGSRRHRSRSRDRSRDERDSGGHMREGGRERNGAHDRGFDRSVMDPSRGGMDVPRDAMRDRDARDVMREAGRDGLKDVARDGMRDVARDAARDPRDAGRDPRDARDWRDGGRDGGRDAHREEREGGGGKGGERAEGKKEKERREKKREGKGDRRRRDRSRDDRRSRSRERRRNRPDAVAGAVEGAVVAARQEGKETRRLSAADDIKKDGIYWYRDGRDGVEKVVQVVAIDRTVKPPSFTIRVDGRERETEAHRLSLHKSSLLPDVAAVQKGAEGNGAREEFIVTKVEDGLEYKTADGFVFKLKEKKLETPQTPLPAENDEEKAKKLKAASEAAAAACMALLRKKEEEAPAAGAAEAAAQSSEASAGAGAAGVRLVAQPTGGAGLVMPASKVMTTLTAAGKALTAAGMVITPAVGMALATGENNLFSPGALGVLPSVKRSAQNSAYVRALKEEEEERAQKEEEEAQVLKSSLYRARTVETICQQLAQIGA